MKLALSQLAVIANKKDNVATVLVEIKAGSILTSDEKTVRIRENIPVGYKIAIRQIKQDEPIIKYSETIGFALKEILPGELVHIHNMVGRQSRGKIR